MPAFSVKTALCLPIAVACLAAAPASRPADSRATQTAGEKSNLRANLLELLGSADATLSDVDSVLVILEQKRQLLIVELAGKRARLKALQEELDDLQTQADKAVQEDASIITMKKALASEQQQLAQAQKTGGTPSEIAERLTEISRQSMYIAEREDLTRFRFHEGLLLGVTQNKMETYVTIMELEAELKTAESQIAQLRQIQTSSLSR